MITIPAAACSKPTKSTRQDPLHEERPGRDAVALQPARAAEPFEYTFNAPAAGKYALTARVVTPSWKQHLLVAANGAKKPADIALPFTVGMWETTKPVEISLVKGSNVLCFSHESEGAPRD